MNIEEEYKNLLEMRKSRKEYEGTILGTCEDFCPYFERIERTFRRDISKYESTYMIKKFIRSAAGKVKELPEDVRPLHVLVNVTNYLLSMCYTDYSLDLYKFVENRTRSIRLDLHIQNLECADSVNILERIARFQIIYGYILYDNREFEDYLNTEQLRKVLSTIHDMYNKNVYSPNVVEFVCYQVLLNIEDKSDVLYGHPYAQNGQVKHCFDIMRAYQQKNAFKFFELCKRLDFLKFCIVQNHFDKIRLGSIDIFRRSFFEKIDYRFVQKILSTCNEEFVSIARIKDLSIYNDNVDFKNKESTEREEEVPLRIRWGEFCVRNPSVYIVLGCVDLFIYEILFEEVLLGRHTETVISSENLNNQEKVRTGKDMLGKLKQQQQGVKFNKDEFMENLTKHLCIEVMDEYIKRTTLDLKCNILFFRDVIDSIEKWKGKLKKTEGEESKVLAIVINDSIFSAIFKKKVKDSNLNEIPPVFINFKDASLDDLIQYNFVVFSVGKSELDKTNKKFYMLNRIVDTPQNLTSKLEEIYLKARSSRRIFKANLSKVLSGKGHSEKVIAITTLVKNGRNPDISGKDVGKIIRDISYHDYDVYFNEEERDKLI